MKNISVILVLFTLLPLSSLFAINGEFFIKIAGFGSSQWVLRFEKIPGEFYYNQNFNLVTPDNLIFTRMGDVILGADHINDYNHNGDFDDTGHEFIVYNGRYKVSVTVNGLTKYFYLDWKDCDYSGPRYREVDLYFRYYNSDLNFVYTDNGYGINNGVFTYDEFKVWLKMKYSEYDFQNLNCFAQGITFSNIINNSDYGTLTVDNHQYNSGDPVPIILENSHTAHTYETVVNGNYKFRNWNVSDDIYDNPVDFTKSDLTPVIASFQPVLPLTVANNLVEASTTGGAYSVTWDKQPEDPHTLNSGEGYDAFENKTGTNDQYYIDANNQDAFNTQWYFQNWSDGEIAATRTEAITSTNKNFTANYKGHFRSNSDVSYNSYQKNFHYLGEGQYTTFYESMGTIWELTAENYNQWAQEADILKDRLLISGTAKNPDLYFLNGLTYLVFEFTDPSNPSVSRVYLAYGENYWDNLTEIDTYNSSFFGNAKPVVAAFGQGDQLEIIVLYKKDNTHGIYYKSYCKSGGLWYWHSGILSGTSLTSSNVSIAAQRNSPDHSLHVCWEDQPSQIKYTRFYSYPNKQYDNQTVVSSQCPLINHHRPSISITGKNSLIVSWSADNGSGIGKLTGTQLPAKRVVVRPRVGGVWGNFFISGSEVLNTFNNSSTSSSADESVIAWNENNNTTTKFVKRINDTYCNSSLLSPNGIMPVISNGGSLAEMKALVFNTESLPYVINKSDADFSTACRGGGGEIGKLSSITGENSVLYGRSGLIMVKGINFIFNTGDIVSGDSVVNFTTTTDTNQFQTAEELNEAMRTVDFELNSSSSLRFSNLYYALNPELADSLSEDEAVSFRLELVNSATEEIMGVFDEITYNKYNLEQYENISYEINCSDILQGSYYLRLVSEVNGVAEYNLGLIQNDVSEIAKKNYVNASYYGDKVPSAYEISQNYPNPFNPVTTINYQLPKTGLVTLKIYDILGKEVATLVNEQKNQGRYTVNFDASDLASGVYIYQLRVNDYVSSKKMLFLK